MLLLLLTCHETGVGRSILATASLVVNSLETKEVYLTLLDSLLKPRTLLQTKIVRVENQAPPPVQHHAQRLRTVHLQSVRTGPASIPDRFAAGPAHSPGIYRRRRKQHLVSPEQQQQQQLREEQA